MSRIVQQDAIVLGQVLATEDVIGVSKVDFKRAGFLSHRSDTFVGVRNGSVDKTIASIENQDPSLALWLGGQLPGDRLGNLEFLVIGNGLESFRFFLFPGVRFRSGQRQRSETTKDQGSDQDRCDSASKIVGH